jgi:hypothetical protein
MGGLADDLEYVYRVLFYDLGRLATIESDHPPSLSHLGADVPSL